MRTLSPTAFLPMGVLALLAGFTFWLDHAMRPSEAGPDPKLRHDPDYWVDDLTLRRYKPDGTLQHTLQAFRMDHFPDDDTTLIKQPNIVFFESDRTTIITAQVADVDAIGRRVQFRDDVRLVRTEMASDITTTIETPLLNVAPDDEYAQTDAPVTLTHGQSIMRGQGGMELNNKTRHFVLNGPVTGTIHRQGQVLP